MRSRTHYPETESRGSVPSIDDSDSRWSNMKRFQNIPLRRSSSLQSRSRPIPVAAVSIVSRLCIRDDASPDLQSVLLRNYRSEPSRLPTSNRHTRQIDSHLDCPCARSATYQRDWKPMPKRLLVGQDGVRFCEWSSTRGPLIRNRFCRGVQNADLL